MWRLTRLNSWRIIRIFRVLNIETSRFSRRREVSERNSDAIKAMGAKRTGSFIGTLLRSAWQQEEKSARPG
jgi:hypothetical protein